MGRKWSGRVGSGVDVVRVYFELQGFLPTLLGATDVLPINRRRKDTCVTVTANMISLSLSSSNFRENSSNVAARRKKYP